jgi:hypothetical protein
MPQVLQRSGGKGRVQNLMTAAAAAAVVESEASKSYFFSFI